MDELSRLAPGDAFRLAIFQSGYSHKVLSERLGWGDSFLRRITSAEKYFPSFEDVPDFCIAVGNEVVIDWQRARVRVRKREAQEATPDYLRDQVLILANELGETARVVSAAVADNQLTKAELRSILREALQLGAAANALAGAVREAEQKVARNA